MPVLVTTNLVLILNISFYFTRYI